MVCAYVREDNPRALESGLFPVHTPTIQCISYCTNMYVHLVRWEIFYTPIPNRPRIARIATN